MIFDFVIFFVGILIGFGFAAWGFYRKLDDEIIGNLLIVKQENEEDALMLEVLRGKSEKIYPGNIVTLAVEETHK